VFMLWAGIYFKNHQIATELGINSQIQIGAISVAIMLLFNFMLVLPIVGTADKIFAKLVSRRTLLGKLTRKTHENLLLSREVSLFFQILTSATI
jgi:hypothetical protein